MLFQTTRNQMTEARKLQCKCERKEKALDLITHPETSQKA